MIQQEPVPQRFGPHASLIQLLALFLANTGMDCGKMEEACTLASLLFWTCAGSLLWWRDDRVSPRELLFLRWGLLPFVLIGTPLFMPVVAWWKWSSVVLLPGMALLLVAPLMYLVTWVFELGSPSAGKPRPPEV
jgi:hypothetical protein